MTSEPSHELRPSLGESAPPRVIDPNTSKVYYLVAAEQYERIRALLEPVDALTETYPAQLESALRAGWNDPVMNDYDRYDELRRNACLRS